MTVAYEPDGSPSLRDRTLEMKVCYCSYFLLQCMQKRVQKATNLLAAVSLYVYTSLESAVFGASFFSVCSGLELVPTVCLLHFQGISSW